MGGPEGLLNCSPEPETPGGFGRFAKSCAGRGPPLPGPALPAGPPLPCIPLPPLCNQMNNLLSL